MTTESPTVEQLEDELEHYRKAVRDLHEYVEHLREENSRLKEELLLE